MNSNLFKTLLQPIPWGRNWYTTPSVPMARRVIAQPNLRTAHCVHLAAVMMRGHLPRCRTKEPCRKTGSDRCALQSFRAATQR